ncbi:MAG: hypothetical protein ABEJ88_01855 [Halobacterium sp.]
MDRLGILGGSAVTATTVTVPIVRTGAPEAVVTAVAVAGVLTGAASRNFQSEFVDAFAAGTVGFFAAVTLVALGYAGNAEVNEVVGSQYNVGVLVYLRSLGFSVVAGLVAAVGGGVGAGLRYAASDLAGDA